jgi:hypothetical protein
MRIRMLLPQSFCGSEVDAAALRRIRPIVGIIGSTSPSCLYTPHESRAMSAQLSALALATFAIGTTEYVIMDLLPN